MLIIPLMATLIYHCICDVGLDEVWNAAVLVLNGCHIFVPEDYMG